MSPKLKEALEIHRITSPTNEDDLVFVNTAGSPLDPDNTIKREFHPALRMAGLRLVRFHDLRHTYTSVCMITLIFLKKSLTNYHTRIILYTYTCFP